MIRIAAISLCVAGLAWGLATTANADRLLAELGPVKAFTADDFSCSPRVHLKLRSESKGVFSSDRPKLEKLVGSVRAVLGFQCEGIKDIRISGLVADEIVFAALTSENTGWRLIDVPTGGDGAGTRPPDITKVPPDDNNSVTALALPPAQTLSAVQKLPEPVLPPAAPAQSGAPTTTSIEQFRDVKQNVDTGGFPTADYKFGGLMTTIYLGRRDDVPDDRKTRANVVSILRAFSENCGEAPAEVALRAVRYGSEQMRQYERNPMKGLTGMLQGLVQMRDRGWNTGDYTGAMADWVGSQAMFTSEGMQDGRAFIARYGCRGREFDQFSRNLYGIILDRSRSDPAPHDEVRYLQTMSSDFRASLGLKNPEVLIRERRLGTLIATTESSCKARFGEDKFCSCAVTKMKSSEIDDAVWTAASTDFRAVAKYPQLRQIVSACY